MWGLILVLLVVLSSTNGQEDRGPRPQLINNRVVPLSAVVASERYEYLMTTLEFDQDIYVNEPFMCPGQEEGCVERECVPCDWTGENVSFFFFFFFLF